MPVVFRYANNYEISDADFRQAWNAIICLYGAGIVCTDLPRLHTHDSLATLIGKGHQFSLEYLCRMLVPNGYKDSMQATDKFMEDNPHILLPIANIENPISHRQVKGARLRPATAKTAHANPDVEALFESDIDDLEEKGTTDFGAIPASSPIAWDRYIGDFVDQINTVPYQPMYRGRAIGSPVTGWDSRLKTYFWPNPRIGLAATDARLKPILSRCKVLAQKVSARTPWTAAEQKTAVEVAHDIFKWGGVPQDPVKVTSENVRNVFEAALTGTVNPGTLMNSGWTKVAAFATAHLDTGTPHPSVQVIWDSRVSTSIIRRLDNIFHSAKLGAPPKGYVRIGLVAGRGGTRSLPLGLKLKWKNGYGSWDAQFVGSEFVREVCQCLNSRGIKMTDLAGKKTNWTVRSVEMVLFGDGY
jgi:hypothetical protein